MQHLYYKLWLIVGFQSDKLCLTGQILTWISSNVLLIMAMSILMRTTTAPSMYTPYRMKPTISTTLWDPPSLILGASEFPIPKAAQNKVPEVCIRLEHNGQEGKITFLAFQQSLDLQPFQSRVSITVTCINYDCSPFRYKTTRFIVYTIYTHIHKHRYHTCLFLMKYRRKEEQKAWKLAKLQF